MRTEKHWDDCLMDGPYQMAQQVQLELRDIAKNSGYDPKGVILHSKKQAIRLNIGRIGAFITWDEGPEDWLYLCDLPIECCTHYKNMLIFYS